MPFDGLTLNSVCPNDDGDDDDGNVNNSNNINNNNNNKTMLSARPKIQLTVHITVIFGAIYLTAPW